MTADTYARLGLRCVDRAEYEAWARPLGRLGTHVTLGRFCLDADAAWCAQMAEAGRCAAKARPGYHRPLQSDASERAVAEHNELEELLQEYPVQGRAPGAYRSASLFLCPRCCEWTMKFARGLCRTCYNAIMNAGRREKARLAG